MGLQRHGREETLPEVTELVNSYAQQHMYSFRGMQKRDALLELLKSSCDFLLLFFFPLAP